MMKHLPRRTPLAGAFVGRDQFGDGGLKHHAAGKNHGSFDEIFQLADIARPVPVGKGVNGGGRDDADVFLQALGVLLDKMNDQEGNIFAALAQWSCEDGPYAKAIVEFVTKLMLGDALGKIPPGSGNEAQVNFAGAGTADSLKFLFLDSTEQPELQVEGKLRDLIQEKSASICQLENTDLLSHSTGEGFLFVSKQLDFQ